MGKHIIIRGSLLISSPVLLLLSVGGSPLIGYPVLLLLSVEGSPLPGYPVILLLSVALLCNCDNVLKVTNLFLEIEKKGLTIFNNHRVQIRSTVLF